MPGYILHLTEAAMITEQLEQEYGYLLSADWKRRFALGCLLPDAVPRGRKCITHFWDPKEYGEGLQALAPDPLRFDAVCPSPGADPRVLGYRAHLILDRDYVKNYWQTVFDFLDEEGNRETHTAKISHIRLKHTGEKIPHDAFFSEEYFYGDYTRMNHGLTRRYGLQVPEYRAADWESFPVGEADPGALPGVLAELQRLMALPPGEEGLRVFPEGSPERFVRETAAEEARRIHDVLAACTPGERIAAGAVRRVDLHTHTYYSDGSVAPADLVRMAADRKLMALAVTDHDTTAGLKEAVEEGKQLGVEVIPGIEFSTLCEGRDVHMVGLFIDPENELLVSTLERLAEDRKRRNRKMVQRLTDAGIGITPEDVKSLGDGIWTRGNLAQILVDRGYASSVQDGMDRYLVPGRVGYEPKVGIPPSEAIRVIHEAGGLVFVAHFHQICRKSLTESRRIAEAILASGADGLETRYCQYDEEKRRMAEEMAEKFGCLRSGGSDFHGRIKPGLELAVGYGDLEVPESYLEAIRERLSAAR